MRNYRKHYPNQIACAHAWAHGLSIDGKSSNLYFEGKVIYSYGEHFPIARIHNQIVFFTEASYSKTTSSHISLASSAVSHLEYIFVKFVPVDDVDPTNNRTFISQNINHWVSEINRLSDLYRTNTRKKSILGEINKVHQKLKRFVEYLKIRPTASLQALLDNLSQDTLFSFNRSEKRRLAANKKRAEKSKLLKFSQTLEKWKKREITSINLIHPLDNSLAYLRINPESGQIETSKGIDVTSKEAEALYSYIKRFLNLLNDKPSFNIAGFNISSIDHNFLKVGCHKIPMEEVEIIAYQKGWKIGL